MMFALASNEFFGALVYALLALLGGVGTAFAIYFGFRKKRVHVLPSPLPVQKQPKRYNHDLTEQRHLEVARRLDGHQSEIDSLWNAVRVDIPAMERRISESGEDRSSKIHDRINDVLEAVSELRGQVVEIAKKK